MYLRRFITFCNFLTVARFALLAVFVRLGASHRFGRQVALIALKTQSLPS